MKARDALRLGVLRMLKSSLKLAAIEKGGADATLDDVEASAVLRKELKKRQDSVTAFENGGRQDLADKEKAEAEVIAVYLPQPLTPEELATLVKEAVLEAGATTRQQMGAVMKIATAKAAGRADGKTLSSAVQAALPAA